MEPDTVESSDRTPTRPSRAAVVAVTTTVLLAVGSSALALSGLRTAPPTTGLAYGSSDAPGADAAPLQPDGDLFLSPGPYGDEPAVVRALPRAPQPLPPPAAGPAAGAVTTGSPGGTSSGGSSAAAALPVGGALGLPALPQLLSAAAPAPAPPGLALGRVDRGAAAEGGPLLGLPPGLLSRSDDRGPGGDDGDRPVTDLLDDEELSGGQDRRGDDDRRDPSGQRTDRPQTGGGDRDPSTEPSEPPEPSTQPSEPSRSPGGDPATVEQMREQAREQAMAMARERFARELEQRRAAAEQEQRERAKREAEQRCDLADPRPEIEVERDDRGRVTAVRASGFGEACVGRTARLELTTDDGAVTGTSKVSDGRSATFSLSRPVAPEKITGSSLSTG